MILLQAPSQIYIPHSSDKTLLIAVQQPTSKFIYIPHSSDKTCKIMLDEDVRENIYIPHSSDKTILRNI